MSEAPKRRLAVLRLGLLFAALIISAVVLLVVVGADSLSESLEAVSNSPWGIVGFIALYIVLVVAFAPGSFATITAAALFGFAGGLFVALTGATIGATLAFLIARFIGREGVVELFGDRVGRVDDFISEREFLSIFVLRLLPIVPFNGLNYASGLTNVRFSRYVPASILGMFPGTALTSWTVSQAGDMTSTSFLIPAVITGIAIIGSIVIARRVTSGRSTGIGA